MAVKTTYYPTLHSVQRAAQKLDGIAAVTPLIANERFSKAFESNIFFKREDLQPVRSYKIRGSYNKISSLDDDEKLRG
ncbi:MAG: pyridoxal-phosphate dependent enzyme, partial [Flavobacteriaceae bacterium]